MQYVDSRHQFCRAEDGGLSTRAPQHVSSDEEWTHAAFLQALDIGQAQSLLSGLLGRMHSEAFWRLLPKKAAWEDKHVDGDLQLYVSRLW